MRIAIHVRSGPASGRRIVLRGGQSARFGKTDWSDYAFTEDGSMADVHFEVHCDGRHCSVRSLTNGAETLVNGQPITHSELRQGDIIRAGASEFQITVDTTNLEGMADTGPIHDATSRAAAPIEDLAALATLYGLSEEGVAVASRCQSCDRVPEALVREQLVLDAIRWQAHRLPKPQAVAWGCACVKAVPNYAELPPLQLAAIEAADAWSMQPDEANRKRAAELLDATGADGVGGALSAAAGWSGGSLAPDGQPEVPPHECLTGRAVFTALLITSYLSGPASASNQRLKNYLERIPKALARG